MELGSGIENKWPVFSVYDVFTASCDVFTASCDVETQRHPRITIPDMMVHGCLGLSWSIRIEGIRQAPK